MVTAAAPADDAAFDVSFDAAFDAVFRALAEPHRRRLLDALRERDGQSLGELCEQLPSLSRFGVMKHLAVLAEADLVITQRVGRHKFHYLNPVPIHAIQQRWISRYADATLTTLDELRLRVETGEAPAGSGPVPRAEEAS